MIKYILLSLSIFIKSLHLIYSGGSGEPSTFLKNENKMQALYKQLYSLQMTMPTCPAWSARRCRRRCRGRTWSRGRGRCWGRGSWTGSWAAAAHTPAAGRSCSRSENITITIRKYLLEKQLLYYFSLFSCYLLCGCNSGAVGTCDQVELLDHCIGGIVPLQHHCNNIATCSFPIP